MTAPSSSEVRPGTLYVVATPIGNLGDLPPRALKVLDGVDLVAAEDTRTTGAMLSHFGVRKRLLALHEHNEADAAAEVVRELQREKSVALVSDAGTPLVSDPGFRLVRAARDAGIPVIAIPGPCAAIAALSVSGLPTDAFVFAGFLPAKAEARRRELADLAREPRTVVLYESAHRVAETLADVAAAFGPRRVCIARELTKLHEESFTAPAADVAAWIRQDDNRQRGEFVLVLEGMARDAGNGADAERLLRALLVELSASRAARVAAELTGQPKKELYALAVKLGGGKGPHEDEA